jgi:hypothetical protein
MANPFGFQGEPDASAGEAPCPAAQVGPSVAVADETMAPLLLAGSRLSVQVSTFRSFGELGAYQLALSSSPGVRAVKVRRFYRGVLYVTVDYDGVLPLVERLKEVDGFATSNVFTAGGCIYVVLDKSRAATAPSRAAA